MSRVSLREATPEDLPFLETWYDEAATAAAGAREPPEPGELRRRFGRPASTLLVVSRPAQPDPIGLLEYHADGPWVFIELLAMMAGQRGWGYGSEAVRLLEEHARTAQFAAAIPPRNGLAVYFWRLLGFRPARPGDPLWPRSPRGDMLTMVRAAPTHART